jgi:hypothetical protein
MRRLMIAWSCWDCTLALRNCFVVDSFLYQIISSGKVLHSWFRSWGASEPMHVQKNLCGVYSIPLFVSAFSNYVLRFAFVICSTTQNITSTSGWQVSSLVTHVVLNFIYLSCQCAVYYRIAQCFCLDDSLSYAINMLKRNSFPCLMTKSLKLYLQEAYNLQK